MKTRTTLVGLACLAALLSWFGGAQSATLFQATPLVDFTANQRYLGRFPGLLYSDPATGVNTNTVPAQHDADGRAIAAQIVPLDGSGNPSAAGRIGVLGIGMSNWTQELCEPTGPSGRCFPYTFLGQAATDPLVNHTSLVLADCAQGGATLEWIDDSFGRYTNCIEERLPLWGLTRQQIEVVLWKDADAQPTTSLTSSTVCQPRSLPIPSTNPDACTYEQYLGLMAHFLKAEFPNVKQLFVHSRIYAGYATTLLNPEPFAYQYGFATKWFVNAQIMQIANRKVDPLAGDLNYKNKTVPWIVWGPYWWAAGTTPCQKCQIPGQTWVSADFQSDGTHPYASGAMKVANNLMSFYLASPYTPWFRAATAAVAINVPSSAFAMNGTFTLGPSSAPISPVTPVTLQVGSFATIIPAGSFQDDAQGNFVFRGVINGVALEVVITPLGDDSFGLMAEGAGAHNLPTTNPVTVGLAIGNNTGITTVSADFR